MLHYILKHILIIECKLCLGFGKKTKQIEYDYQALPVDRSICCPAQGGGGAGGWGLWGRERDPLQTSSTP